jgi:UDP-glucose 4-epimerase
MTVLVTGGAGFIGANLCRALLEVGDISGLRVLDDLSTGRRENLQGLDVEIIEASLVDPEAVAAAADGVQSIVHLGALGSVPRSLSNPVASHAANTTGTLHVLEAARATDAQVVVASSSSVYGANPTLPKREDLAIAPVSPYAATKVATESYARAWRQAYGMPVVAFRFFNVYGPLQRADHPYAAVIPKFIDAALAGRPVEIHGDGRQSRDFTYVDTVTDVLTRAVVEGVSDPDPVNLAFGVPCDLLGLLDLLEAVIGTKVDREHVPPRAGDVRASDADSTRLDRLFPGLEPVDLEHGLRATVDWFRSGC